MLQNLAPFVNDQFLPEEVIEGNTFSEALSSPARSKDEEESPAMSFALKIEEEQQNRNGVMAQKNCKGNDEEGQLSGGEDGV